ncbi:uncharacterized protein PGRI_091960 [Penicillium griseofulvum]|uniref:Period circadian protein n=1 Tax=Penicillium patulum TaxID=5078 RepID=A0A135LS64_PENPA|nr:uncharacterized protein PGRI_091960 [Penicillium griseofulvum]KXG51803.1 hypothetical protein PGRI_091960 [Penicillium griseofulvum]
MQFVRKAEEALTGKKDESHESTKSSNHGPHKSNLANKLDPRVDSDKDNRAAHTDVTGAGHGATHGTTPATGTHTSTLGSSTTHGTSGATSTGAGLGSTHGTTGSTNAGPHNSNIANKLDPRVDSDRDNRAHHEGLTGSGTTHGTSGVTGTHGTTATGTHSTNTGPHSSNIANKVDPRVDSDRDNRAQHGLTGASTGAGLGSTHHTAATGTHGTTTSTNAGPHSSNIANKVDPRVDSDRDNRAHHGGLTGASTGAGLGSTHGTTGTHSSTLGSGTTHGTSGVTGTGAGLGSTHHTAATGTHGTTTSTNAGPHSSNIANKVDPRVDSDRDNRAQHGGLTGASTGSGLGSTHHTGAGAHSSTLGSGPGATHSTIQEQPVYTTGPIATPGSSSTNAGPHSSNIANKLDPRVDSDRDSSAKHQSTLSGAGTTTHGTHTRGTTAPTGSLGGSGLDTAGRQDALAGSSYNAPAAGTTGTTGTTGPHGSSIANKLDPRVDSDVTRTENERLRQI